MGEPAESMTQGAQVSAFDAHRPPAEGLIEDCVHCGFCLPTCPTYALWGEEMDSPRGRVYLMQLAREGATGIDATFARHFDACLGCMACVTSCPSGVQYDRLLEAVRPQVERNFKRRPGDRAFRALVFGLFPHPGRLRVAATLGAVYQKIGLRALARRVGLLGRLPPRLRALEALLPPLTLRSLWARIPSHTSAIGPPRRRVGLLTGCVQRVVFGDVNAATVRVLAAEGCDVVAPRAQGCCGALLLHAGREAEALDRARALIDVFGEADVDTIVVNVAGCGSSMKAYAELLSDDPAYADKAKDFTSRVRDVSELLADLEPRAARHPIGARVAYHDACHLAHAQGVRIQPRELLRAIPGLEVVDTPDAEICCGSAGIYNLVEPEAAAELGRRKAAGIATVKPDAVATANAGCLLQIRRYLGEGVPLFHPIELVDASIRGADPMHPTRQ